MDKIVRKWITEVLQQHESLVSIAVQQRAKFEGWLKFELAAHAQQNGATNVRVEAPLSELSPTRKRSDITFNFNDVRYDLELKTPNSNWRMPGVDQKRRPITRNISGIINDGRKLAKFSGQGLVAFVLFPVPSQDRQWIKYLQRIAKELEIPLSEKEHCNLLKVVGRGFCANVVVCCFAVPTASTGHKVPGLPMLFL